MIRVSGPVLLGVLSLALIATLLGSTVPASTALSARNAATPTPDRLAIPAMPESPTQVDLGRNLYYYHCMPCHGDQGQGLTDEWRQVWVEDHQNCWAGGCHGGRAGDEGFPIPRSVPAVNGPPQAIASFQTADKLFDFLSRAHPPQRPGALQENEYWALTAFLLYENGRLPLDGQVGPTAAKSSGPSVGVMVAVVCGMLLSALFFLGRAGYRSAVTDAGAAHPARGGDRQHDGERAGRDGDHKGPGTDDKR